MHLLFRRKSVKAVSKCIKRAGGKKSAYSEITKKVERKKKHRGGYESRVRKQGAQTSKKGGEGLGGGGMEAFCISDNA